MTQLWVVRINYPTWFAIPTLIMTKQILSERLIYKSTNTHVRNWNEFDIWEIQLAFNLALVMFLFQSGYFDKYRKVLSIVELCCVASLVFNKCLTLS